MFRRSRASFRPALGLLAVLCPLIVVAQAPESRGHFALAYDEAAAKVVMTGGVAFKNGRMFLYDDCWAWNGKKWSGLGNTGVALMGARMTYDAAHKRLLLLAGSGQRAPEKGELRALVSNSWVTLSGATELKGLDPGLAIDIARNRVVAFIPGPDGGDPRVYEWDGRTWRPGRGKAPAGHQGANMAYDEKRGVIVLFGGRGVDKKPTNDVWEYDGLKWMQSTVAGPNGRAYAGMAYNDKLGAVVVHGGMNANSMWIGDTWSWDGRKWTKLSDSGPVLELAMAYDKVRDRLVVVGDSSHEDAAARMETWEFDGTAWKKVG